MYGIRNIPIKQVPLGTSQEGRIRLLSPKQSSILLVHDWHQVLQMLYSIR